MLSKSGRAVFGHGLAVLFGSGALGNPWFALANETGQTEQPDVHAAPVIEEVLVTARKRVETEQRVPLTMGVLSAKALAEQNITRLEGVGKLMPNVGVEPTPGTGTSASISLRGISVYDFELYIDPPVAMYVNGVNYARPQMFNFDNLIDVERVEVLYGPQGTLFGRNTTGGAISVTTQAPRDQFGVRGTLGYGSDDEFIGRVILDTGYLGDTGLKAKLAYAHRQRDGWQRNLNTTDSRSGGASDNDFVSLDLAGELTDRLSFAYRFDFTETYYNVGGNQIVDATEDVMAYFGRSPSLGGQPFLVSRERLDAVYQNHAHPRSKSRTGGHALTATFDASDAFTLKSITAYRFLLVDEINNGGAQGFLRGELLDPVTFQPIGVGDVTPFSTPLLRDTAYQFSQELQVTGAVGPWTYAAGLFFFREKSNGNNLNKFTVALPGGQYGLNLSTQRIYGLETKSYAGYGQVSYRPPAFGDRLEVTAGLRYTVDDKSLDESLFSNDAPAGSQHLENDWNDLSENFSLSYRFTDTMMGYARVATAYKAGGYNPGVLQDAYGPEEARVYELGIKSDLFERRLRLNAAVFRTDYDKIQVSLLEITPTSNSTVLTNAAAARYTGAEVYATLVPAPRWQITANVGYVDPEYTRFDYRDPVTLELIDVSDEARSPLTSKLSYNIGVQYEFAPLPIGTLSGQIDYAYRSKRYYFPLDRMNARNEIVRGDPQRSLRARLSLADVPVFGGDSTLRFDLWGDNLLDDDQRVSGIDFGALGFGTVNFVRPRSYGLSVSVEL